MEIAAYMLLAITVVFGFLCWIAADNRDIRNWLACFGIVIAELSIMCALQDFLWKRDAAKLSVNVPNLEARAYMGTGRPDVTTFEVGKPIDFAFTFKNSGRTPARVVEKSIGALVYPAEARFGGVGNSDSERIESLPVVASIPPGEAMRIEDAKPITMSQELLDSLNDGTQILYLTSAVYYRDVVENKLRTERVAYRWNSEAKAFFVHEEGCYPN